MHACKHIANIVKDKCGDSYSIHIIVRCVWQTLAVGKSACMHAWSLVITAVIFKWNMQSLYSNRAVIMKLL